MDCEQSDNCENFKQKVVKETGFQKAARVYIAASRDCLDAFSGFSGREKDILDPNKVSWLDILCDFGNTVDYLHTFWLARGELDKKSFTLISSRENIAKHDAKE